MLGKIYYNNDYKLRIVLFDMEDYIAKMLRMEGVSCDAAQEIDECTLGRNREGYECCERVAEKLNCTAKNWMEDPTFTLSVYRAAGWKERNIKEVLPKIERIAQELSQVDTLPRERQEHLRGFCIELSRQLISRSSLGPSYLAA